MCPRAITIGRNVIQDQACPDRVRRIIIGIITDLRAFGQDQILPCAEPLEDTGACWMLPARVTEHGCFVLVIKAKSAHPAILRLVLFGKLPASGSAAVQMAYNETCPRVTRETQRPAPRLVRWLVREMHGS